MVIKSEVIELNCPVCGKLLKIKSEMAGRQLHCPKPECGAVISVPGSPDKSPEVNGQFMTSFMISAGIVFALIAAVLAIREINLGVGWIVSLGLVTMVFAAEFFKGYAKTGALALFAILGMATPALFFVLERKPESREFAFFTGSALFFALSVYAVARNARVWGRFDWRNSARTGDNLLSCVVWFAAGFSSISFAWVAYYKFLTSLGQNEFLARRLAFTLFFVVVGVIFYLAPGFKAVRHYFFNWNAMKQSFFGDPSHGDPSLWRAFLLNVKIFLVAEPLILVLALAIAVVRQIPGPVFLPFRLVAIVYTDFFRGVPTLLVIIVLGFGFPALGIPVVSSQSVIVYGTIGLVLSYSAYVAEVYRAGIESVHPSQMAAARSLGLSRWQGLRFVVIPQAVRRVIPPLLNDFIALQKDTALLSLLGVIEVVRAAGIYSYDRFNYSSYTVASILFILLTIPLARFTDRLLAKQRAARQGGGVL